MIKKHNTSSTIVNVTTDKLNEFFKESVVVIRKLSALHRALKDFMDGEIDDEDIFD